MRNLYAAVATASLLISGSALADELLLTSSSAKAGAVTTVDYVSTTANAVGVELHINVPAGGTVDLSRFAKDLPKGFTVQSNVVNDKVIAIIFNSQNQPLAAGVHSLGVISSKGGTGEFSVNTVYASDAKADAIAVKSTATDANK